MSEHIEVSTSLPIDPDSAFALVHTVGDDRTCWDHQTEARMLIRDHREVKLGAQVFERVSNRRRVIVEYDSWYPSRQSSTHLLKGPFWLAEYGEGWHVQPAEGGSRVTLKITWRHASPIFANAAAAAMSSAFTAEARERIADLLVASEDAELVARVRKRAATGELPANARHRDLSRH